MNEEAVVEEVAVVEEAAAPVEEVAVESPSAVVEGVVAEEKSFTDDWIGKIEDEELKGNKILERLAGKSADEVAQYLVELNSWNGKKGDIPAKDATQEEIDAFQIKMGRPETAEGYDFSLNDDFVKLVGEQNAPLYQGMVDGFKDTALKVGLSEEQASEIMEYYLSSAADDINGVNEVSTKLQAESQATIDKEWGDSKPQIEGAIHAMLQKAGADTDALKASGALADPAIAIPLGKIAKDLADDPEIGHHMTRTITGLHDQLAETNALVAGYIKTGEKVPAHIAQKRATLMNKLGENL